MIDRACRSGLPQGSGLMPFSIFGAAISKRATDVERKDYMLLLDRYRFGQASKGRLDR